MKKVTMALIVLMALGIAGCNSMPCGLFNRPLFRWNTMSAVDCGPTACDAYVPPVVIEEQPPVITPPPPTPPVLPGPATTVPGS